MRPTFVCVTLKMNHFSKLSYHSILLTLTFFVSSSTYFALHIQFKFCERVTQLIWYFIKFMCHIIRRTSYLSYFHYRCVSLVFRVNRIWCNCVCVDCRCVRTGYVGWRVRHEFRKNELIRLFIYLKIAFSLRTKCNGHFAKNFYLKLYCLFTSAER